MSITKVSLAENNELDNEDEKTELKSPNNNNLSEINITSFHDQVDRETFIDILFNFLNLFISNALLFLALYLENLISLYFLSSTYNNLDILDAVGLVDMYCSVLMFSFITFVISVFTFQGPVSYGSQNYKQFGLQLHRTLIIAMCLWLVLYTIHYFSASKLMLILGMDIYQYEYFDSYIKVYMIANVFEFMHQTFTAYLCIINKSWISVFIILFTLCLHVLLCFLLITILNFGVIGASLATLLTNLITVLLEFSYIMIFKPHPESFFFFTLESFDMKEIWEFLKFYFSMLPIGICAFWSGQIQAIIAFSLKKYYLGAHVVLKNIEFVAFSVAIGSAIAASMAISLYIGQKQLHKIKVVLYTALVFSNCLIVFVLMFFIIFRHQMIGAFINDEYIIDITLQVFPLYCFYLILEVNNYVLEFFFRSCGFRLLNIITPIVAYFVLMLGLSLILTQVLSLNILGLWISSLCAEVACVAVFTIVFFVSDIPGSIENMMKEAKL